MIARTILVGVVHQAATEKTSRSSAPYAAATILEENDRGPAFRESLRAALKALPAGAEIAVVGEFDAKIVEGDIALRVSTHDKKGGTR